MQVGSETFRLCRELLDGVLLVDNQSISGAIESVFNDKRSILEPAGAVAVAGATQYLEKHNLQVSPIFRDYCFCEVDAFVNLQGVSHAELPRLVCPRGK